MAAEFQPNRIICATLERAGYGREAQTPQQEVYSSNGNLTGVKSAPFIHPHDQRHIPITDIFGNKGQQEKQEIDTSAMKPGPPFIETKEGVWTSTTGKDVKVQQTKPELERDITQKGDKESTSS